MKFFKRNMGLILTLLLGVLIGIFASLFMTNLAKILAMILIWLFGVGTGILIVMLKFKLRSW